MLRHTQLLPALLALHAAFSSTATFITHHWQVWPRAGEARCHDLPVDTEVLHTADEHDTQQESWHTVRDTIIIMVLIKP
jgi:hypothetical protein